jgi:very-short-patch-repair endonuclease
MQHVIPEILRIARDHRHPLTPAEAKIWARVRNRGLGFKIRRQHPIWRFIADFYCAEARLVIEIDGDSHAEPYQAAYDQARTEWLEARGYKVIRIMNEDVHRRLENALNEIFLSCKERVAVLTATSQRSSL